MPDAVAPFARLAYHRLTFKDIPSLEAQAHNTPILVRRDNYGEFAAGVGVTVRGITVRPGISIPMGFPPTGAENAEAVPFGREEGERSFNIAVAFGLWRRATRPAPL